MMRRGWKLLNSHSSIWVKERSSIVSLPYCVICLLKQSLLPSNYRRKMERSSSFTSAVRNLNESTRMFMVITTFVGVVFGFFIGLCFAALPLTTRLNIPAATLVSSTANIPSNSLGSGTTQAAEVPKPNSNITNIWVPTNPRGAERLPPTIVAAESDLYLRRLWGNPSDDLPEKPPKYLVTFTVGIKQKKNVDANVRKFSVRNDFTVMLFHYDGKTSEWDEFEWSKRAIHVSAPKQTKWWYAKRFLHPDIVAAYDYIFIWDEDLGVDNFDPEEYLRLVKKHRLEISQPGLYLSIRAPWPMTHRIPGLEVHKEAGCSGGPYAPPCTAFVEIMAPVFSRQAWRCVWHLIQNDLVHGWGLDFNLRRCVAPPAHEKIGVVDAQWIVHQSIPTLGSLGIKGADWLKDRCYSEMEMFQQRIDNAEKSYYKSIGVDTSDSQ